MEVSQKALSKMLRAHALFRGLDSANASAIASCCQILRVRKGQVIFRQGTPTQDLYIPLSGRIRLTFRHEDGVAVVISVIREGTLLGGVGFLDEKTRTTTATAITNAIVLRGLDDKLAPLIHTDSPAATSLLRWLREEICRRNRNLTHRLDGVFSPDALGEGEV